MSPFLIDFLINEVMEDALYGLQVIGVELDNDEECDLHYSNMRDNQKAP